MFAIIIEQSGVNMIKDKMMLISAMLLFGSLGVIVTTSNLMSTEITMFRGIIGGLFVLIYSKTLRSKPHQTSIKDKLISIVIGILIGVNWVLLFESYKYLNVSLATILYYMAPFFLIIYGLLLFKEKIMILQVVCVILAMIGVYFIMNNPQFGATQYIGIVFALVAAIIYASVVSINKHLSNIPVFEKVAIQLLSAGIFIAPYVVYQNGFSFNYTFNQWMTLLMLGIFHTGIAYTFVYVAISRLNNSTIAIMSYVDPLSAVLFAYLLLNERLDLIQWIGVAIIMIALSVHERFMLNKLRK